MSIFFLLAFAAEAYFLKKQAHYALILTGTAGVGVLNISAYRITRKLKPFLHFTIIWYFALCVYLLITGGQENTGILWHYAFPLTVYFVGGLRLGFFWALLLICLEIFVMVFDDLPFILTRYPFEFKTRFLSTMIVCSFFGGLLEYSRNRAERKLVQLARKFELASQTDELTGLANRRAINTRLEDEIWRVKRADGDFAVVLCDIDYFKKVNDIYGHIVGDETLSHVADIFHKNLRKYDVAARWGGEEFLFLLPDSDLAEGVSVAERLRQSVEKKPVLASTGEKVWVTISCGVCNWKEGEDLDLLIRRVDEKLYKAKSSGRNSVVG